MTLIRTINEAMGSSDINEVKEAMLQLINAASHAHDGGMMNELEQCLLCGMSADLDHGESIDHDPECPSLLHQPPATHCRHGIEMPDNCAHCLHEDKYGVRVEL
jgi:hypothetical protein